MVPKYRRKNLFADTWKCPSDIQVGDVIRDQSTENLYRITKVHEEIDGLFHFSVTAVDRSNLILTQTTVIVTDEQELAVCN